VAISENIGSATPDNTPTFLREGPLNNPAIINSQNLGLFIASSADTIGTFLDTWTQNNVENASPSSFTNSATPTRSDLYEVRREGVVDPHTGQTEGAAYWVGYFQFNTNGTITFTRAS